MAKDFLVTADELISKSKIPLSVMNTENDIFVEFAVQMVSEIIKNNEEGKNTVFILPCGPIGQYSVFASIVNGLKISLKNTYFIHMDEYLTDDEELISENDVFSFRKCMNECLYSKIDKDLVMPLDHRIFPDPKKLDEIPKKIEELGGVDIAFGGVALNGHIAFNEPRSDISVEEFSMLPTRIVSLNAETRIKDAILARGGAIETVAKKAITIGLKEILSAKKVRLSMMLDMQRFVVRKACLCEPSSDCPVSIMQLHPDAMLFVTKTVTEKPF